MKAAIYARVSTKDQDVEMQLKDLSEYARQRGFEIHHEYVDRGISGSIEKRPALDALMADANKRKFKVVLVWRFDRFARSTKHLVTALSEFRTLRVGFISINENIDTSSPLGEAIFTIIGAMAQLERDIIRERVRGGLRNARAKGKQLGRRQTVPYSKIQALHSKGLSIRAIAEKTGASVTAVARAVKAPVGARDV